MSAAVKSPNKLKFKKLPLPGSPYYFFLCTDFPAFIGVMPDGIVVRVWEADFAGQLDFDPGDVTRAGQWWADDLLSAKRSIAAFYADGLDAAVFACRGLSSELIDEIVDLGAGTYSRLQLEDKAVTAGIQLGEHFESWEHVARFGINKVLVMLDGKRDDVRLFFQMMETFSADGQTMDESFLSAMSVLGRFDLIDEARAAVSQGRKLGVVTEESIFDS